MIRGQSVPGVVDLLAAIKCTVAYREIGSYDRLRCSRVLQVERPTARTVRFGIVVDQQRDRELALGPVNMSGEHSAGAVRSEVDERWLHRLARDPAHDFAQLLV